MPGTLYDPASGLLSEGMLNAILPTRLAIASRQLRPLAVVMLATTCDDDALAGMGSLICLGLRSSDTAYRLQDGRIVVLLEETAEEGALVVARRLCVSLMAAGIAGDARGGVAVYPQHALESEELFDAASVALAAACADDATMVRPAAALPTE